MSPDRGRALLGPNDPPPVAMVNAEARGRFLLIGDHAGDAIPDRLGDLGVGAADRGRHIAVDIGIRALGTALAGRLDAPFVYQHYSRLVIDCNRDPDRADAVPAVSDGTIVPANADLSAADRAERVAAIHAPYQAAIGEALAARRHAILVSLHSFTPLMAGVARPWHVGLLHDGGNLRFTRTLLAVLGEFGDLVVGDNEPYRMDGIDHTVPRHAFPTGRPYVEIEVRQDLIGDAAGVDDWTDRLAVALVAALDRME